VLVTFHDLLLFYMENLLIIFTYLQASVEKWMTIPDMGYVIASKYNVILICLSLKQNVTIFFITE